MIKKKKKNKNMRMEIIIDFIFIFISIGLICKGNQIVIGGPRREMNKTDVAKQ